MARCEIPNQWLGIEKDTQARELVESTSEERARFPMLFFPDSSTLVDPELASLANKAGVRTQASEPIYDIIIVGTGSAGFWASCMGRPKTCILLSSDRRRPSGHR